MTFAVIQRQVLRLMQPRRAVKSADIESFVQRRLEAIDHESELRLERRILEDVAWPDSMPLFGRVLLDGLGHLWVAEYSTEPGQTVRWAVFGPAKLSIAKASLPGSLNVLEIGEDYVLGVEIDELGVERTLLYELVRPRPSTH